MLFNRATPLCSDVDGDGDGDGVMKVVSGNADDCTVYSGYIKH